MSKASLLALLCLLIYLPVLAQRRLLPIGSELVVKEITSWDPEYKNKDKIVDKKAVVSTRPLLFNGEDHWAGFITVDGTEYRLLDMRAEILSGLEPEKKKAEPKDAAKLQAGLKELVAKSIDDFASVKSNVAKSRPYHFEPSFLSSYQLSGSEDSSTLIYFDEHVKRWNLETHINAKQYTGREIDNMLTSLDLPCGKLEPRPGNDEFSYSANIVSRYYVPVDRKEPGNKFRYFTILLSVSSYHGDDHLITIDLMNRSMEPLLLGEQMGLAEEKPVAKKDMKKMEKDILALVGEYKTNFEKIKKGEQYNDEIFGTCYKVNYQMEGSEPEDGVIILDKSTNNWKLNIPIAPDRYSSKDIDQLLKGMNFSFGKLEGEQISGGTSRSYWPKDRAKLTGPYKDMGITVLSSEVNNKEIMVVLLIEKSKS